jgi:parallel beta-helix repeat protein
MKKGSLTAALLCVGLVLRANAADWYVATNGNDQWTGHLSAASKEGNDGPFATFEKARSAIRAARTEGDMGPQTVHVREGMYRFSDAFRLQVEDSGSDHAPVIWRAFEKENPVISGAFQLKGWTHWKGKIQRAPLGSFTQPKGGVRQILLGGARQTLARYPNLDPLNPVAGGWAFAEGKAWPMYADIPGEDKRTLEVKAPDWRAWAKPGLVEVTVFPRFNWWNSRARIASADGELRKVTLASDCSYAIRSGDRYFFQNAIEEIDSPGEWYADPDEALLYFWPPDGKNPAEAEVVIANSLLRIETGAHDIVWRGFVFQGTNGTAVNLVETERCVVENNTLRAVGEWGGGGVAVYKGKSNRVTRNTIDGAGNTAVSLSGGDTSTLTPAGNVAEHNQIHHFGIYFKQGVGVALSGVGNSAIHNDIHHGPRFGVMHSGNKHDISYNHIHDVCLETEDTGAIYSGGRDWITPRGSTISYNFIHDVPGFSMHNGKAVTPNFAWGIYLDDNSGGADVVGNIVTRCGRGGLHAHGARDCVVQNNIFYGNKDWQVDFHGWSTEQTYWEKHMPSMVKGYESVADKPDWKQMRGVDLHPKDTALPNGLTMRGNRFERNVVVSASPEVPVVSLLRVPFTHNVFDSNLYWAPEGRVRTGFQSAGPSEGSSLLAPWDGAEDSLPTGWRLISKQKGHPLGQLKHTEHGRLFQISCLGAEGDTKASPVYSGPTFPLEQGASYRLSARLRASIPGKGEVAIQSYLANAYFWMNPRSAVQVGTDWKNHELIFEVPKPDKPGGHAEMKLFSARLGWRCDGGVLEVADLQLHRVTQKSEFDALREQGADRHSSVADPCWEDGTRFTLSRESPAWKLGFKRIPIERIGPQPESTPHR